MISNSERFPQTMPPRISGVIVARNEEQRIGYALASVRPLVDEIICFDMESSDKTSQIAEAYGAKIFHVGAIGAQDPIRHEAVAKATGDWVLMFDADELLTSNLREALRRIADEDSADVVSLPRRNYLFGREMTGAMMGPNDDRQIRFFKKDAVVLFASLHTQPSVEPGRRLLYLSSPEDGEIVHFNYVDISSYLTKLSRYTQIESLSQTARAKYTHGKTLLKIFWEFTNRYLLKKGYRDGWRGLYIALSMSFYRLTIWARVQELQDAGTREHIEAIYARKAEQVLAEPAERNE